MQSQGPVAEDKSVDVEGGEEPLRKAEMPEILTFSELWLTLSLSLTAQRLLGRCSPSSLSLHRTLAAIVED